MVPAKATDAPPKLDSITTEATLEVQAVSAARSLVLLQDEGDDSSRTELPPISEIRPSLDYAWGDADPKGLPGNFAVNTDDKAMERIISTPLMLQWQASNVWYHPLYFEDGPLERYGHTYDAPFQYVLSPVKFLGQTAMLPYNATLRPVHSREYPLGWYRPGEFAPYLKYKPAWNGEAAVNEALAVVGLFFLIP